MGIDVQSLLVLMVTNVIAIAVALTAIMGWRVDAPARCVQGSIVAQALGWIFFLIAPSIHDRALTTVSMALLGSSFVLMWHALGGWLGPRPGRTWLWGIAVAMPLGYGIGFEHYAFRVGWSNFGLGALIGIVCLALVWPAPGVSRRWRTLVVLCLAALGIVTVWRGVLGAFFTELYPYYRAPHPVNITAAFVHHIALVLTTIGFLVAWREDAQRKLVEQANIDLLTGLLNRRAFTERALDAFALARRHGHGLVALMIDIDHFKRINDEHGHAAGDDALRALGQVLRTTLRRGDLACRYGGEEFCVLLSNADAQAAAGFDTRLRGVLKAAMQAAGGPGLTFSAGLAVLEDGDPTLEALLRRADFALYEAKTEGRNRLVRDAGGASSLSTWPLRCAVPAPNTASRAQTEDAAV